MLAKLLERRRLKYRKKKITGMFHCDAKIRITPLSSFYLLRFRVPTESYYETMIRAAHTWPPTSPHPPSRYRDPETRQNNAAIRFNFAQRRTWRPVLGLSSPFHLSYRDGRPCVSVHRRRCTEDPGTYVRIHARAFWSIASGCPSFVSPRFLMAQL